MTEDLPPAICVWNPDNDPRATALASGLDLPVVAELSDNPSLLFIYFDNDRLVLGRGRGAREHPIAVDFQQLQRDRHRGKELLLKAIGGRRQGLTAIDATAGLGRDSFLLASYGATVHLCERQPVVAALLADGLRRGRQEMEVGAILERMHLHKLSATEYLRSCSDGEAADVIYLDPMFPPSGKTALVKKEMRLFHDLVGQDMDADSLLAVALAKARHRVVVKRPPHAPVLGGTAPQLAVSGKAVRFDIYPIRAFRKS